MFQVMDYEYTMYPTEFGWELNKDHEGKNKECEQHTL